jgi:hypothetical protein
MFHTRSFVPSKTTVLNKADVQSNHTCRDIVLHSRNSHERTCLGNNMKPVSSKQVVYPTTPVLYQIL